MTVKHIVLQTIPHTGTHTMVYLLKTLGGLPLYWHHWEPERVKCIECLRKFDRDNLVLVRTHRPYANTIASYRQRDGEKGVKQLVESMNVFKQYGVWLPADITVPIMGSIEAKTEATMRIFEKMETEVPLDALRFMKTWTKLDSYSDREFNPGKGYLTEAHYKDRSKVLRQTRIIGTDVEPLRSGVYNGT